MRFFVGTSGYSYKEWKGKFYPEKMPQKEMLSYYSSRFSTVEINNSFYRMPSASVLSSWLPQVPPNFRFVLKVPQTITHRKRLKEAGETTRDFLQIASTLGDRLGPAFFQLPPNMKKDVPRLAAFLDCLPSGMPASFEFRHESWFDDEVYDCLRVKTCALCVADTDEMPSPTPVQTANWGYARLRRESYSDEQLAEWVEKLRSQKWNEVYVFFKHEDTGSGARFATRFLELIGK